MTEIIKKEVIIIGAGPAGSVAAYGLARRGHRPLLLEKDSYPGEKNACGGGLTYLMKDHLRLPPEVIEKEISVTRLCCGNRVKEYVASAPQYISIRRRVFDRFLASRACEEGGELLPSHLVRSYDSKTGVLGVRNLLSKSDLLFQAPLILFADGPLTLAHKFLGLGVGPEEPRAVSLVYELASPGNREDAFTFEFTKEKKDFGYCWIFPKKETLNVGVGRLKGFVKRRLAEELGEFIAGNPDLRGREVIRKTAGFIPLRLAKSFSGDHALVLGDAAGLVNPLTGGGLVYAVISGQLAAEAAHQALLSNTFEREGLVYYDKLLRRSKYVRWLKLVSCPYRICERRFKKGQYSFYPGLIRLFFSFSFFAARFVKKI